MGLTMENVASQETVLSSRLTAGCPRNGVFSGHCYGIWQIDFQDAVEQLIMCRAGDHYKEMMCVCVCVLGNFQLFATPWTVALCYSPWYCRFLWTVASWIEAPLFMGFFWAGILEQVAIFHPRVSSWPRDWTHVSCISCTGRQILYHWATWGVP